MLRGENTALERNQKSIGPKGVIVDSCDMDDYSSTTYLKDLNRHKELVMQ